MYYTGIGSRETPVDVLQYFERLGEWFSQNGWVLRSGHADGADRAFEMGCDRASKEKEIYIPWRGFNNSESLLYLDNLVNSEQAYEIARQYHPNWNNLKEAAKKLMARNTYQILGMDLRTPSRLVVCWTKGGKEVGGTSQALRIARACNIKVINAGSYSDLNMVSKEITEFLASMLA
jgi:hypothetical protein